MTMKRLATLLLLLATLTAASAKPPRLVVQIVVGSMRADDLDRYADGFGPSGFRRLAEQGAYYTDCRYEFQLTTTPATLSTLATGAMPSMHGVIGENWIDYTTNRLVWLTDGRRGPGGYELIAPTLAETLCRRNPASRAVSVALEPTQAVLLAGRTGSAYWIDDERGEWSTSRYYAPATPAWVERLNNEGFNIGYLFPVWQQLLERDAYRNTLQHDIRLAPDRKRGGATFSSQTRYTPRTYTERLCNTPAGNSAVLGFAKQAIVQHELGKDEVPDLLNIYLDASRRIGELYGPASIEVEDTYYRLDRDLGGFLDFLYAQVPADECLVVLTSDHGTSDAVEGDDAAERRFNPQQFRVIVNGFLNVRYGTGAWVQSYQGHSLYLNRTLVYERNLDLGKVQSEVATFATQFSGVAHALPATALVAGGCRGYALRMQNSFYPRRSGDVVLNLLPGLIEEAEPVCSTSGSMYAYDAQVPLLFCGAGIPARRIRRTVDAVSVAPTLARLLEIGCPDASEGTPLAEITE